MLWGIGHAGDVCGAASQDKLNRTQGGLETFEQPAEAQEIARVDGSGAPVLGRVSGVSRGLRLLLRGDGTSCRQANEKAGEGGYHSKT